MRGAIPPLLYRPSWRGVRLNRENFSCISRSFVYTNTPFWRFPVRIPFKGRLS